MANITEQSNAPVGVRLPITVVARLQFDAEQRGNVTRQRIAAEIIAQHYGIKLPNDTVRRVAKIDTRTDAEITAERKIVRDDRKRRTALTTANAVAQLRAQLAAQLTPKK